MDKILTQIRDLTIIVGIYLYFIAWVYVTFYYSQFGISTEAIKIDYNSYLMYSYNVLRSAKFLYWVKIIAGLVLIRMAVLLIITVLAVKYSIFKKMQHFLSGNVITQYLQKLNRQYPLLVVILVLVIIFPLFFKVSREIAIDDYRYDRLHTEYLKTIQFIFRKDADMMSPAVILDSVMAKTDIFYSDVAILKNDSQQLLRLLGESDSYYIVLQQRPFNKALSLLPSGFVYFIDKKDVLFSKIILRSTLKN